MSALDNVPTNRNFLSPLNFKFQIKKSPNVNFFLQQVNIPGFSIQPTFQATPFVKIPKSGDHIDFEDLRIKFKVDEDLVNYMEIYDWLRDLGFPNSFQEYAIIASKPITSGMGIVSDISLLILNSNHNPKYDCVFKDCYPISISDVTFDTTQPDVQYIEAEAIFKYRIFEIQKI